MTRNFQRLHLIAKHEDRVLHRQTHNTETRPLCPSSRIYSQVAFMWDRLSTEVLARSKLKGCKSPPLSIHGSNGGQHARHTRNLKKLPSCRQTNQSCTRATRATPPRGSTYLGVLATTLLTDTNVGTFLHTVKPMLHTRQINVRSQNAPQRHIQN